MRPYFFCGKWLSNPPTPLNSALFLKPSLTLKYRAKSFITTNLGDYFRYTSENCVQRVFHGIFESWADIILQGFTKSCGYGFHGRNNLVIDGVFYRRVKWLIIITDRWQGIPNKLLIRQHESLHKVLNCLRIEDINDIDTNM